MLLTSAHPSVSMLLVYGVVLLPTARPKISYRLGFLLFFGGMGELKPSHPPFPPPCHFFLACLKAANPIFFCHSPFSLHLVGCTITISAIVAFSFSSPPPVLFLLAVLPFFSLSPPLPVSASFPTFCVICFSFRKKNNLTPLQIHCCVFFLLTW